jgi:preprotein translocase subunit SecB
MKKAKRELSDNQLNIGLAPLQIDGYYVKEFSCSVRDDLDEKSHLALGTGLHIQPSQVMLASPMVDLEVGIGEHLKDRSKFRIMLDVKSDDKEGDSPYTFSLKLMGYFSVEDKKYIEEMSPIFHRNAVMLLYSAAREIVASSTGRGPFPAYMLPTLSFNYDESVWAAIDEKIKANEKQIEAKKKPRQLSASTASTKKKKASKKTSSKK